MNLCGTPILPVQLIQISNWSVIFFLSKISTLNYNHIELKILWQWFIIDFRLHSPKNVVWQVATATVWQIHQIRSPHTLHTNVAIEFCCFHAGGNFSNSKFMRYDLFTLNLLKCKQSGWRWMATTSVIDRLSCWILCQAVTLHRF